MRSLSTIKDAETGKPLQNATMSINVHGITGDDSRTGETADNNTLTGYVASLTRVAALSSAKTGALNITIAGGTVELNQDIVLDIPEVYIFIAVGATLKINKRTILTSGVSVGEGNYKIRFFANNVNIRVEGTLNVESNAGAITPTDYNYMAGQGAFAITSRIFLRQAVKYQCINLFNLGTVTVGDNATLINNGSAGINRTDGGPSVLAYYLRENYAGSTFTLGTNAVESLLTGNRVYLRTYTPTSSTDANVGDREIVSDASFLYRKQGGVIKKIAWATF